ncbi:MAG TPA: PD-(D/E)XK nuclease family protein [Thermoanaerobaculia bacterium]
MNSIVSRLSELCREQRLREKIVVVPSLAVGHQIGDAIARSGTPWVNLRFETTRTIADAVAGLELAGEGKSVLSRAQALALVERACDRVIDDASYFAELRSRPGLHRAIQRSLDDLRLAGIRSLESSAFEDAGKGSDLGRILAAYERELSERQLVDRSAVISRAIQKLEAGAPAPWSGDAIWISIDELELPHEESRLVSLASRGAVKVRIAGAADTGAAMPPLSNVRFVRAQGEENEIRAVFRSILGGGNRLDDAELVYTSAEPYLALAYELCAEHSIAATFAEGIATSFTRPGQACLAFLRWCGSGWAVSDLIGAAQAGVIRTRTDSEDGTELAPATLARVLRGAAIGWGRDRYEPQLQAMIATAAAKAEDEERSEAQRRGRERDAANGRATLNLIRQLLEITHELTSDRTNSSVLARAAGEFVRELAYARNELDRMALAALTRMFDELSEIPDAEVDLAEGCARLRDAVLALHTGASNPRPGHLHVTPVRSGAWSGRRHLFLVGLDQAKFPGAGLQDPIMLDAERDALNGAVSGTLLARRSEAPLRASERLRRFLARGGHGELTIGFSSRYLGEQRESFAANDLLDVFRAATGNPSAKFKDLLTATTSEGFIADATPLGPREWWLAQRFVVGRADYEPVLFSEYPWLRRGDEAERARESTQLTRWDGVVALEPQAIDPRLSGRILSASQIEKMASCPYGWFLRYVLKIEPIEELIRDPDRWLDPRHRGSLLHEVFERTMKVLCESGQRPALERHLELMATIADEELEQWRGIIPPPNEPAFERQRLDVLATCEAFLRLEEKACSDAQPMFFELPFGFTEAEEHPAGMIEPLTIDLGGGRSVKLRGRIDRVDRLDSGGWTVWDYKTGSTFGFGGAWTFAGGRKVQHAIYARATEAILRERGIDPAPVIVSSGYSFPTVKGLGERHAKKVDGGSLVTVLNQIFDVIGSGFFPHPEDDSECTYCEYAAVCGGAKEAASRSKAKLEANEANEAVVKWRSLRATS